MFLKEYIESYASRRRLFKQSVIDPNNITPEQAQELFQCLDSDMSPEALHMDGERPIAQARRLAASYTQCFEELKSLGFKPEKAVYHF